MTESKMLRDAVLDVEREVDIVVEGTFDGDPVMTSIEVIERRKPGDLTWVEQLITKHQNLPTNRLILVSQSGFTKNALALVAKLGGSVEAIQPKIIEDNGQAKVETLYADLVQLRPTLGQVEIIHPSDGQPLRVDASTQIGVFAADGSELGNAYQLVLECLNIPWIIKHYLTQAHNHPDRENLGGFSSGIPVHSLGYHLRSEPDKNLQMILSVYASGELTYTQSPMSFTFQRLGEREYGAGKGDLFGLPGVWVRTHNKSTNQVTITWKVKGELEKPIATNLGKLQFPGLRELPEPDQISTEVPAASTSSVPALESK